MAFIESNLHLELELADIAGAAFVTPRAIQYAFRRHLGTTPMGHLRRVRLDRVHHDLIAGDPSRGDTVTVIAARWGFRTHSRFAAEYRATYGQRPGQTLRS